MLKKCSKILLTTILTVSFLFTPTVNTLAYDDLSASKLNVDELSDKYDLKDIEKLPEGIKPIVITSEEQLMSIINPEPAKYLEEYKVIPTATRSTTTRSKGYMPDYGLHELVLIGTYELYSSGSFTGIDKVIGSSWSLTGYTLGLDLSHDWTSHSLNSGVMKIDGGTDVDVYLYIKGLLKLFTYHINAGFQFEPQRGLFAAYHNKS